MEIGRREVVGKVREGEAERLAGLIEGEKGWRRGFDDEVELAGVRAGGRCVLGILGRERVKGRGERIAVVFVALLRARGESGGLCLGWAMATARWWPAGARCCVARQGRHNAKAKSGGGGRA